MNDTLNPVNGDSPPHTLYTQGIPDVEADEKTSAVWFGVERPDYPDMVGYVLEDHCPLCGHKWRQHDPADGKCDCVAHSCDSSSLGVCSCGRDLAWMRDKIRTLSRKFLQENAKNSQS